MAEDLRKLYDGVSSQLDVGDYNTFVQKMQTPQDRKRLKSGGKILNYPGDYEAAARSTYYKQNIRAVIQDVVQELNMDTSSNKVVEECWKELEDSRTLREFREYLKLYFVALFSNFYTDEDIAEYVEMIDEQDRELRRLREYKRIQDELFGIMTENDEELHQVIQAKKMREGGIS